MRVPVCCVVASRPLWPFAIIGFSNRDSGPRLHGEKQAWILSAGCDLPVLVAGASSKLRGRFVHMNGRYMLVLRRVLNYFLKESQPVAHTWCLTVTFS